MIEQAIEPKTKSDQEKLGTAIQRLAEEDPTLRVHTDDETGQTIIAGMGELHLEVLIDRMKREFRVEANIGKPQVAYRETLRRPVQKVEYAHKKQSGGSGQYAKVIIDLEPLEPGSGYEFVNAITGGRIPRSTSRRSTRASRTRCSSACWPVTRWRTSRSPCRTGRTTTSILRAGLQDRWLDGVQGGGPQGRPGPAGAGDGGRGDHPEDYLGTVIGDLNARRGTSSPWTTSTATRSSRPWCCSRRCSATSATCVVQDSGQANYSMEFHSYAETPKTISDEIIKKVRGE